MDSTRLAQPTEQSEQSALSRKRFCMDLTELEKEDLGAKKETQEGSGGVEWMICPRVKVTGGDSAYYHDVLIGTSNSSYQDTGNERLIPALKQARASRSTAQERTSLSEFKELTDKVIEDIMSQLSDHIYIECVSGEEYELLRRDKRYEDVGDDEEAYGERHWPDRGTGETFDWDIYKGSLANPASDLE